MMITQWHVPVDDDEQLLVRDLHQLRRAGRQGTRCGAQRLRALRAARLPLEEQPQQRLRLRPARAASTRPTRAWARTSTCTTSGRSRSQGAIQDRTREHLGCPTRRSPPTAACCASDRAGREGRAPPMSSTPRRRASQAARHRRHRSAAAGTHLTDDRAPARDAGTSCRASLRAQLDDRSPHGAQRQSPTDWSESGARAAGHDDAGWTHEPSSSASASGRTSRSEAAARCSPASSRSRGSNSSASSFPDQHGMLRGKTLIAGELARVRSSNGCAITTHAARQGHLATARCSRCSRAGGGFGMRGDGGRRRHADGARPDHASASCPGRRAPAGCCATSTSRDGRAGAVLDARISTARRSRGSPTRGYDYVAGLEVEFHVFKLEQTASGPRMRASPARRRRSACSPTATSI